MERAKFCANMCVCVCIIRFKERVWYDILKTKVINGHWKFMERFKPFSLYFNTVIKKIKKMLYSF